MLAVLALFLTLGCVVSACQCRGNWVQFSRRKKRFLIPAALSLVAAYAFMLLSGWHFTSPVVNEITGSIATGCYTLLVLVTLFRPKPLTYSLTALLLLPVPIALLGLPLAARTQGPVKTDHISGTLFVDKVPWDTGALDSGTTLLIYDKPRSLPFIQHSLRTIILNDSKCVSSKAFVLLQADGRHILARCPLYEHQGAQGFHDFLVPIF